MVAQFFCVTFFVPFCSRRECTDGAGTAGGISVPQLVCASIQGDVCRSVCLRAGIHKKSPVRDSRLKAGHSMKSTYLILVVMSVVFCELMP